MKCKLLKDFVLFYFMSVLLLLLFVFFIGFFLYGEEELTVVHIRYPIVWGICYAYQELFYFVQRYISSFYISAALSIALLSLPIGTLLAIPINFILCKIGLEKK
ncbi:MULTISPECIES: hypothetical protein [unclassified Capnocytophaga]|uniref:hypothetical protein n=1 Tax=unclassified Capnocytophaga TaxID=2640652 RepID=UPI000202FB61|nr:MULTISPECIES: hypothetical protein [unclassified Capnocytophaga]EGD34693.1 hypothetical protein HMPREF9071_0754 [Capnocytophaga sp. oral taxon 338 str. F0234]MEB3005213.1 hypothetical protein [Capnocytophaga sp. G2]